MKKIIFIIVSIAFLNFLNPVFLCSFANSTEKYVVQVGVFQKQSNADRVYNILANNKFPVYKDVKDKIWVYVGTYNDRKEAEEVLRKIKKLGISGYIKKADSKQKNSTIQNNNNSFQPVGDNITNMGQNIKSKNYHLNEDVTINGIFGSHTFFVDINKHWQIKNNAYLELIFSQSPIKNYKNSTLTIEVNNSPIHSVLLYDKGANREKIRVPIPADKIYEGFNEVKIKVYHRITDEPCTDIINPGNWIVFHKDSYVHLDFIEKEDSLSLSDYPYPYLKENSDNPINNIIVIPDKFHNYEVNAATILSTNFGQRFPYSKLNINISKYSDAVNKNKSNIIYIGSKDNTPEELLSLISSEEINLISDRALIKEVKSPYNSNYKMLLILANDQESMLKSVKALANDKMILQMDKSYQFISNTLKINDENIPKSEIIYLKDLGYSNIKLQGIFYQNAVFGVNIPKDWILNKGALLHIDMRYSEVLNFEKSVLTVYLNDVPIGSKKLYSENANNDAFEIEIPDEIKDSNYYNIKIVFYLELESQDCNYIRDNNSWAYISNQSYLYLPHEKRKDSFFENYESPFISDKKFNDLLVVVPDDISSYDMKITGSIASALGRNANSLEGIEAVTVNEARENLKDKNLIIIGTPDRNSLIKDINSQLHIKFDKDFNTFLSNDKITLLEDYNNNLASLQLIKSPFNENKSALIITATKDEGLRWAKEFLTDFELVNRLKGNAVVIGKSGNIQWQYYGVLNDKEEKRAIDKKKDTKQEIKKVISSEKVRNYIVFIIAVLCFIILSSILIGRKKR